jgi:hypothetical protein
MATGVTVKAHGLFESNDDNRYVGVTGIVFDAGMAHMTLTASASGANFSNGLVVPLYGVTRVEILKTTAEFPGNSLGTPSA